LFLVGRISPIPLIQELPMRAPLILAITLAFGLVACNNQQQPPPAPVAQPQGPAPVAADATAIRGQMTMEGLTELPRGLQLRMRLLDMTDPSVVPPVVSQRLEPAPSSLPYTYALPFDADAISPDGRYVIDAALLAEDFVMYGTPAPSPVLTNGGQQNVNLQLTRGGAAAPVMAPADALRQQFDTLEGEIGGMTRIAGERIDSNVTVGWDAFVDAAGVRFAREVVDFGDAGTASFRYAYRPDGQPWVVAREQRGVLTLVGWDEEGTLLLNRVGEDNGGAEDAEVARLRSRAEELFKIASRQR
jgi:uncharacterized lipoprotein YbaY